MLRRIEGLGAGLLRRADRGETAALARRALDFAGVAGTMLLLCRAQPAAGLAPFAMAFMAAALLAGWSAAALVAGCMLGAARGSIPEFDLALPSGAAVVLGGSLAADALLPGLHQRLRRWRRSAADALARFDRLPFLRRAGAALRPAPGHKARSPNPSARCAALAGTGVLVPGLIDAGGDVVRSAQALGAALAAVAAAPFIRAALDVRSRRHHLAQEEKLGLSLLACAAAAGLSALSVPAALCLGAALSLLLYPCGALAGAGLGLSLLLARGDARLAALTTAFGAAAQLCGGLTRRAREGVCGATAVTAALCLGVPGGWLAGVALAPLAAMPLPDGWLDIPARWARGEPASDPARLAALLGRDSARRLRALGEAFHDVAEGCLSPELPADERALAAKVRAALCAGCGGATRCWSGCGGAPRLVCELIAEAAAWSEGDMDAPLFDGGLPPDVARRCRRAEWIAGRTGNLLEDFARGRRASIRRGAEHRLLSAQLAQASRALLALAEREGRPARQDRRRAARAAAALEREGFETGEVMATGARVVAALRHDAWTRDTARMAAARLTEDLGRPYAAAEFRGREAVFTRLPRLRAQAGAACAPREGEADSGDSCVVRALDGDRLLVLICDGMGSGAPAARESAAAVRLLEKLLASGMPCAAAVDAANALLLNRGGEDMFATVDLLLVSLRTGAAELVKLAASPTLLLRGGEARWIGGSRLPLGILEDVRGAPVRLRLSAGDALLMGSDGVMDSAGAAALEDALRAGGDARDVARRALRAAERACGGQRRDDMTCACVRLSARMKI